MNLDLIIRNGHVVTGNRQRVCDIGIRGEKVAAVRKRLNAAGAEVIDAGGKYVLPGVVDPHVHFGLHAYDAVTEDDFRSGTEAAACGGVTTIIDYAIPEKDESPWDAVQRREKEAAGKAVIDYSFHAQITSWDEKVRKDVRKLIRWGIPSFKVFMPSTEGWMVDDAGLYELLGEVGRHNGIVEVHAENGPLINHFLSQLEAQNKLSPRFFPRSRPNVVEEEAVTRAITLNRWVGGRLYVVHLTTRQGLEAICRARKGGMDIYAETAPQYLLIDSSCFKKKRGYRFLACPPVKSVKDNEALWKGIKEGMIDCIGTDHCSFSGELKKRAQNDFRRGPYGLPGVETSLSLLFTEGCQKRGVTLQRLVELLSGNPARIFGLYPDKGCIKAGSDADLVLFDPEKTIRLDYRQLATRNDWSPYQGELLTGGPVMTIARGEIVARDGKYVGTEGRGKFLKRKSGGGL